MGGIVPVQVIGAKPVKGYEQYVRLFLLIPAK